jgi:hypothetical protein
LQALLRLHGYGEKMKNATDGLFDVQTYLALVAFQCAKGVACIPGGPYTEVGVTGEATRHALNTPSASKLSAL